MQCNVGSTDRLLRIVIGAMIIGAGFALHSWLGAIGIIPIATALVRFCPAYTILGISTDKP